MDYRRIGRDQFLELIEHAQPSGGVCVENGATLNEIRRKTTIVIEDAEPAGPPVAALVDISASSQQDIDHLAVGPANRSQKHCAVKAASRQGIVESWF